METIYLSIAGYIIAVHFEEPEIIDAKIKYIKGFMRYHKSFIIKSDSLKVDYDIEITWDGNQEIVVREKENKAFIHYCTKVGSKRIRTYYQTSIYQFQVLLRDVMQELLSQTEGYIFHASSILKDNKAYVFTGSSGAGKSTIVNLASKNYRIFTDDAIIIKKREDGQYWCYQTPFLEKNNTIKKRKKGYLLHGMYILKKSLRYNIACIEDKHSVFKSLAKQLYTTKKDIKKQLGLLFSFVMIDNMHYYLFFGEDEEQIISLLDQ